ncbi:unnamed protein product [Merluccius merluccius]
MKVLEPRGGGGGGGGDDAVGPCHRPTQKSAEGILTGSGERGNPAKMLLRAALRALVPGSREKGPGNEAAAPGVANA